MELKQITSALWRWWWLVLASTLVATTISFATSLRSPRVYSAATTLMVGQTIQSANPQAGDFQMSERLAQSYAQLVRREPVLQATADALGLSMPWQALAGQVNSASLPNTPLIQISALANDRETAVRIANEVARQLIRQSPTPQDKEQEQRRQFVAQQLQVLQSKITDGGAQIETLQERLGRETSARAVQDLQGQIATLRQQVASWQSTYAGLLANQSGGTNNLSIVDPAVASPAPISPNVPMNVAVASSIGLALAVAAALLFEYFDDRIRTADDVLRTLKLPTIGIIRRRRRGAGVHGQLLNVHDLPSSTAESYRLLRTGLQYSSQTDLVSAVVVTSAVPGEGKSTIASNLALMLAQSYKRVVLCDADFRRPTIHQLFRIPNAIGFSSLLLNDTLPIEAALVTGPVRGLYVLPSGPLPPNPAELLSARLLRQRMVELEEIADVVIFDSPALLAVTDAVPLAVLCGSAILVIDSSRTPTGLARRANALLDQLGVPILGVVLNKADGPNRQYERYYSPRQRAAQSGVSQLDPVGAGEGFASVLEHARRLPWRPW